LKSGSPVQIQCFVTEGDLPIKITWAFHGPSSSVMKDDGIKTMKVGEKSSMLMIDSVSFEHAGMYTVSIKHNNFLLFEII